MGFGVSVEAQLADTGCFAYLVMCRELIRSNRLLGSTKPGRIRVLLSVDEGSAANRLEFAQQRESEVAVFFFAACDAPQIYSAIRYGLRPGASVPRQPLSGVRDVPCDGPRPI